MKLSQFKFKLPQDLIAQYPVAERDQSRLMVIHRASGEIEHRIFKDIIDYFDDGDIFVFNDTKVFPARLFGNKEKTGRALKCFCFASSMPKTSSGMCLWSRPVKSELATSFTSATMSRWWPR